MNGEVSCVYPWMYFSVSKMLCCLDRGGGLFSCCAFSLFVVCLVYLLVSLLGFFLNLLQHLILHVHLWAPFESPGGLHLFSYTCELKYEELLCFRLVMINPNKVYIKRIVSIIASILKIIFRLFIFNPPFFTTVCQIFVMPELNTSFCINLHCSFIGQISKLLAFLSRGQNYRFVDADWNWSFFSCLLSLHPSILPHFFLILFRYFFLIWFIVWF